MVRAHFSLHATSVRYANFSHHSQGDSWNMRGRGHQADVYYNIDTLQANCMLVNTFLVCLTPKAWIGVHFARRTKEAVKAMHLWVVVKPVRLCSWPLKPDSMEFALLIRPGDRLSIIFNVMDSSRSTTTSELRRHCWAKTYVPGGDWDHPFVRPMAQIAHGL